MKLWIHNAKDFWAGIMFMAVGGGFAVGALNYSFGRSAQPGPGYFPLGLGVVLVVLGLAIFLQAFGRPAKAEGRQAAEASASQDHVIGTWAWRPLWAISAAVVLFAVLLPKLGMLITLPLVVLVSSLAEADISWRKVLLSAIILTAMSYGLFVWGLNLNIPL